MSLYPIMSSLPQKPTENTFQSSSAAGPSKICASRDSCSGIRDPAKFVPLNQYGQGVWSSDYTLLEEGRRQIAGWGKGIKIEEVNGGVVSSRGRGRGSRAPKGQRRSKTDGLRRELERYGCRAEFMPEGMGRKKTNQSSWNPKTEQLHLTVHLIIPSNLILPSPDSTIITSTSFKTITHPRVLFHAREAESLPTISSLLPSLTIPLSEIRFCQPFHSTPFRPAPSHQPNQKIFYPPLDANKPLKDVLKGSAWVEFPEIQLMARETWEEMVDKGEAIITEIEAMSQVSGRERDSGWGAKRRLNEVAEGKVQHNGTKRLKSESNQGLLALGEYDSEEGSDAENGAEEADDVSAEEAQDQDPSPEILAAVGRALMADLEEA
ncbi:hypothetical protein CNBC2960 [Cryptococcus deneoformans B-3501A]|uniref:hypothetical protein n=1 Tax=Cryptococcus deneoformans (strain B-3501A) TaxID=283643 RepID=UPI000042E791|nr:hypothetical protein CNBC2960 [Cryptococcus neoformans var. neoformans B-3501A]EAL22158.1 hypothetical protein CNBC2960 [Cryptococcus neoformans var. neoformans B-3501A]